MHVSKPILLLFAALLLSCVVSIAFLLGRGSVGEDNAEVSASENSEPDDIDQSLVRAEELSGGVNIGNPDEQQVTKPKDDEVASTNIAQEGFSDRQQRAIDEFYEAESKCRGSSDPAIIDSACEERDAAYEVMRATGICLYNSEVSAEFERYPHVCRADSY